VNRDILLFSQKGTRTKKSDKNDVAFLYFLEGNTLLSTHPRADEAGPKLSFFSLAALYFFWNANLKVVN